VTDPSLLVKRGDDRDEAPRRRPADDDDDLSDMDEVLVAGDQDAEAEGARAD
jgi:hypothetical protein